MSLLRDAGSSPARPVACEQSSEPPQPLGRGSGSRIRPDLRASSPRMRARRSGAGAGGRRSSARGVAKATTLRSTGSACSATSWRTGSAGDHRSGLLAEVLACALPWHPLAWWARHRLGQLSELACDDWVLAPVWRPTDYAETLLSLVPAATCDPGPDGGIEPSRAFRPGRISSTSSGAVRSSVAAGLARARWRWSWPHRPSPGPEPVDPRIRVCLVRPDRRRRTHRVQHQKDRRRRR